MIGKGKLLSEVTGLYRQVALDTKGFFGLYAYKGGARERGTAIKRFSPAPSQGLAGAHLISLSPGFFIGPLGKILKPPPKKGLNSRINEIHEREV
jgi:hypothetical protein